MIVLLTTVFVSLVLVVVTAAAAGGAIHANGLVGLRTPTLMSSEAAWRAGHRAALRVVLPAGLALAAVAGGLAWLSPWSDEVDGVLGAVLLGAVVLVGVVALVVAQHAAREATRRTPVRRQPPMPLSRRRR